MIAIRGQNKSKNAMGRFLNMRARFSDSFVRLRETKMRRISAFFYSPVFIYALSIITLALYFLGIDEITYSFLILSASAALVFCRDALPACAALFFLSVAESKGVRITREFTAFSYALIGVACAIGGVCAIFHIFVNFPANPLRGNRLIPGFVALSAGLITGGFFFKGFVFGSLLLSLKFVVYIFGLYIAARFFVRLDRETLRYFAFICMTLSLTVGIQLGATYLINKPFIESGYSKDCLRLGWGASNSIGEALFHGVPMSFYLVCTEEKHSWYYFSAAACFVTVQLFTFARASLLFTIPIFALCFAISCIFGKNRKQVILCGFVFAALLGIALLGIKGHIKSIFGFFIDNGLNDRGRFPIWNMASEFFLDHPIFGVGMKHLSSMPGNQNNYHNTLLQFAAAGGIVGIGTYLYHRMQTVALFTQRPTIDRTFAGILAGGILLISLLDCFYFYFDSQMFIAIALAYAEYDLTKNSPPEKLFGKRGLFSQKKIRN